MVRFLCIVFGLYNIFILSYAWVMVPDFFYQAANIKPGKVDVALVGIFVIFLFVHSICLATFQKHTNKIQTILCSLDPFMRIMAMVLILSAEKGHSLPIATFVSIVTSIIVHAVFIGFDIFVILYLRSNKAKNTFVHAVLWRKQKSINKMAGKVIISS